MTHATFYGTIKYHYEIKLSIVVLQELLGFSNYFLLCSGCGPFPEGIVWTFFDRAMYGERDQRYMKG